MHAACLLYTCIIHVKMVQHVYTKMLEYSNNIPINIPGHPYILMNGSILCNCNIEAESNFLLESQAACEGSETKTALEMHFTLNLAFVNYFDDMMEELGIPVS